MHKLMATPKPRWYVNCMPKISHSAVSLHLIWQARFGNKVQLQYRINQYFRALDFIHSSTYIYIGVAVRTFLYLYIVLASYVITVAIIRFTSAILTLFVISY